ncbi:MAG: hypothetical protein R2712_10640 [Vicinamibacterales bacterium]
MPTAESLDLLQQRVDAIEGGYEFLLAYAAQGLATDEGNANSEQLRTYLKRMEDGIAGLESAFTAVISGHEAAAGLEDFLAVLARDAATANAALKVVSSRRGISSQLVDNLNASIHLRALLTDLFLLDEAVKGLS